MIVAHLGGSASLSAILDGRSMDTAIGFAGLSGLPMATQPHWALRLEDAANAVHGPRIFTPDSPLSVWVIPTDEEQMIADHAWALIRPEAERLVTKEDAAMKRILVATDGSEGADRAVRYAATLAGSLGADLLILNVIGGYGLPGGVLKGLQGTRSAWFEELLASNSAKILQQARDVAASAGGRAPVLASRHGDAALTVLDYAREQHVDTIVVGKRGEGQLQGLLLGSLSQKIVSLAPVVVIVVP